jgi:hypothetical protein
VNIQHTLVREILVWLHDLNAQWQRDQRGPASKFYPQVHVNHPRFSQPQLEALSKQAVFNSSDQNQYLFLEPINDGEGIVPVLSFRYDFRGGSAELWLQLALFTFHDGNLAAIGCRFEPPEGRGPHDYFHAQMLRSFRGRAGLSGLPGCPPWLPTSRPAFHLKADDAVTLLISMVISLYGLGRARDLQETSFANELKPYMNRLCPTDGVRGNQPVAAGPINRPARRRPG